MKNYLGREVPGMIEPVEQDMLESFAKSTIFQPGDCVIEFGTFFGRSTLCLSIGLQANSSFTSECKFYAYDSFECHIAGVFYPYVALHARQSGVEGLVEIKDGKVGFLAVFEHYLKEFINSGILFPQKSKLTDSFHFGGRIKILHIDSPKFYKEFKVILFRFFPYLDYGSTVIFQDFFYHWSASIIAVCGLMMRMGLIVPERSAATSLVCKVKTKFDLNQVSEIELEMERGRIPELIDFARQFIQGIEIDRPQIFEPRLLLAKIQYSFERGDYSTATDELSTLFNSGGKLHSASERDFLDLMSKGFSIRELYAKDHPS